MNSASALVTKGHTAFASCCCLCTSPPVSQFVPPKTETNRGTTGGARPHVATSPGAGSGARADGHRASIDVSKEDADGEGRTARELLAQYNSTVGGAFEESAQPSPENCGFCPCIPFCEAFWRTASPAWAEQCGVHLEGTVSSVDESTVQGMKLTTLRVEVQRGTVGSGDTFVEQVPDAWITADGADAPRQGDAVRVVNGKLEGEAPPQVIRVNRTATSVWTFAAER